MARLRNEYGARLRGGPGDIEAAPGAEVEVDDEHADYYVEEYGFVRVDADDEEETADTSDDLDDLDYRELQDRADEYDDVAGNQSAEDLREALREKREG